MMNVLERGVVQLKKTFENTLKYVHAFSIFFVYENTQKNASKFTESSFL